MTIYCESTVVDIAILGFYNNPEDASSCLEFYHKKGGYHHGEFDLDNVPAPILRGSITC